MPINGTIDITTERNNCQPQIFWRNKWRNNFFWRN